MLTTQEKERYNRQISIPEIGEAGQERLKAARVVVAGLGGLGCVSAMYLAAAGIGRMRIVDRDRVALDNLNRQLLHGTPDLGRAKTESAEEKLNRLNPLCRVDAICADIKTGTAREMVGDAMLIVDATDNRETRRILNRAALANRIPFIYGGIEGLGGMVSTFIPGRTPCFDCLFPESSPPRPREIPVAGPAAGVVAAIQSLEAIKYLVGMEGLLAGRLLTYNGADFQFKEIRVERNPECPACADVEAT